MVISPGDVVRQLMVPLLVTTGTETKDVGRTLAGRHEVFCEIRVRVTGNAAYPMQHACAILSASPRVILSLEQCPESVCQHTQTYRAYRAQLVTAITHPGFAVIMVTKRPELAANVPGEPWRPDHQLPIHTS